MREMREVLDELPVAVIGAGPVGLAAAAHLHERGLPVVVLEAGAAVGEHVAQWAHVRLFSPWSYVVDEAAARLLAPTGWQRPEPQGYPTGGELREHYLLPLAATAPIARALRLRARVVAVTRFGVDKLRSEGRERAPFEIVLATPRGEERLLARAVVDASGTWSRPNPLGSGGVPAPGEREARDRIRYGMPDVLGEERARYAGRHTLVVGAGHSAFGVVLDLAALAEQAPGTTVTWAVRRGGIGALFGGGEADALAARGRLGQRVRGLVERGSVRLVTGFRTAQVERDAQALRVVGLAPSSDPEPIVDGVDEVVAATGFRPDFAPLGELRLGLDPVVESTPALAPLIDPNEHSCGTVRPHGAAELAHPEPDLYVVGMKSYGRAPTFLLLTGYEQVRSVAAALAGDAEAAARVQLELPETGVCSGGQDDSCALPIPDGAATFALAAPTAPAAARACC